MKETLTKELDFINEANNSKRCYNELKHLKFIHVPKVHDQQSTSVIKLIYFLNLIQMILIKFLDYF
jgi:predicted unusual protein kinase regulating ubiquinone biosynthesis (AarF/ABC1/UbiB family)